MDPVVVFGQVVMVLAGLKLLVVLVADTVAVIKQALSGGEAGASLLGFSDLLAKLPERYLTSIVSFLFGLLLANPSAFAALWGKASA